MVVLMSHCLNSETLQGQSGMFPNLYLERDLDLLLRDLDLDLECFLLSSFLSEREFS